MTSVTKVWAFALVVLTTLFATSAQFFLKAGVTALPELSITAILFDIPLLLGLVLYGLGSFIMVLALKGGDVSGLYPVVSTSFVWVALLAHFWLGETVHVLRWTGIIIILVGILAIGYAGRHPVAA